jgi:FtsP/CotA-like multicopper oxidase with cupredoxin domain
MTRRDFLSAGAALTASATFAQQPPPQDGDVFRLRIAAATIDVGRKHMVRTVAYNGQTPGPLFRWKEGQVVTVEVANNTADADLVHWHGFHIPPEVDGSMEEGTPMVEPYASRRYTFTVTPAGTRWYHSHMGGGRGYQRGTYTGQFGVVIVESAHEPGGYDLDVPIVLHEWEPSLVQDEIEYRLQTVNGRMLGAGEPVRVKPGQKVLFRIVNASATATHRIALAGHSLRVIALDGNAVATPRSVQTVELGPAERADCIVEMNSPGVWIMGETRDAQRNAGMGIAIEYAGAQGPAKWLRVPDDDWDYTAFGDAPSVKGAPDATFPLQFKSVGEYSWTINGKSWPKTDPIVVREGGRYRLLFDNQSSMAHPVHLHRHTFEIVKFAGKATSGVYKDVVMVPGWKEVEVELIARNPGLSLFHCHNQFHMDQGFMAMLKYSGT